MKLPNFEITFADAKAAAEKFVAERTAPVNVDDKRKLEMLNQLVEMSFIAGARWSLDEMARRGEKVFETILDSATVAAMQMRGEKPN